MTEQVYQEPIYDRTPEDIANRVPKAFMNISDWMRIYMNSLIVARFIDAVDATTYTWNEPENGYFQEMHEPTTSSAVKAFDNLSTFSLIVMAGNIYTTRLVSGVPTTDLPVIRTLYRPGISGYGPNYIDVNSWEFNIDHVYKVVKASIDYRVYSGVAAVGQQRFYQARWRKYPYIADAVSPVQFARSGIGTCGTGLLRQNDFRRYA